MFTRKQLILGVVIVAGLATKGFGHPSIQVKGATTRTIDKDCPMPGQNNCDWSNADLKFVINYSAPTDKKVVKGEVQVNNGPEVDISTAMGLPKANGSHEIKTTWNLVCTDAVDLDVKVTLTTDEANGKNKRSKTVRFRLSCNKPVEKPKIGDGGSNYIPPSDNDTSVPIWIGILNADLALAHDILLEETSLPIGWSIEPPLPPLVSLGPGETSMVTFDVIVPAGTAVGTEGVLTLTGTFSDDATAQDTGTASIIIAPFGACCEGPSDACNEIAEAECTELPGTYFGDDTLCDDVAQACIVPAVSPFSLIMLASVVMIVGSICIRRSRRNVGSATSREML